MYDYKTFLAVFLVILSFAAYVPYIRDVLKGKTTPHFFTWLVWSIVTAIIFALQRGAGAGSGSWVTLATAITCFSVCLLSLRSGTKNIRRIDFIFLVLSLISLFLWVVARQPTWSAILACSTDLLSFFPTIRKSWNDPYSETLSLYGINTFKHGLSLFGLRSYSIVTWLYPATWTIANLIFSIGLIVRRKKFVKK